MARSIKLDNIALRLYFFSLLIITLVPFGRGSISGIEIAVPFILASFVVLAGTKKKFNKEKRKVIFFFFLWVCWVLLGIAYSYLTFERVVDYESSIFRYFRLLEIYVPALLVFCFIDELDEKQSRMLAFFLIFLFFLVTAEATFGWFHQVDSLVATQRYSYPGMGYIYRAGGVAKDSSAYGSLILVLGLASIYALRTLGNNKVVYVIILFLFLLNMYISMTRTLLFSLMIYFIVESIRRKKIGLVKVVVSVTVLSAVLIYGLSNELVLSLFDRISGAGQSDITSGRLATWSIVPDVLSTSPLFGVGYRMAGDKYGIIPDNVFLSTLLETGVIGFILYFSFLLSLCMYSYKCNREKFPLLIAFISSGLFVDISTFWVSIPILIFVLAEKRQLN